MTRLERKDILNQQRTDGVGNQIKVTAPSAMATLRGILKSLCEEYSFE